ncbi:MAG: transcriptional regulator [Candidatus Marinimicrobia bacterium]|nr:transcriptional regulator [Candidatus Neomarinimicrobiota bacterium]
MKTEESLSEKIQSITEIDKLIHEPARLMIMAYLYVVESADFLFIMRQTGLTKGNLSSHLSKLEAGGLIDIKKEFVGKIPRTFLSLSQYGRTEFENYQRQMRQFLENI